MTFCLLVVAKAPVPGLAKTRLCPPATPEQAAAIAAAALLDTLDAVLETPGAVPLVAMTGDVDAAAQAEALSRTLHGIEVIPQRGETFAERLAAAHADAAELHPGLPVLQVGMDTPQVTPGLLAATAALVGGGAVLGPATDGGWWALGLRDPRHAAVLARVPMSRPDTASRTNAALTGIGLTPADAVLLSDVDTMADARYVANAIPHSRFAKAVAIV